LSPTPRRALDRVLVDRGLVDDLDTARVLIASGQVLVGGAPATTPGRAVASTESVSLVEQPRFVGRGGEKLDAALAALAIDVTQSIAIDVGASTGGFTDCLLARGATRVLAVDVGTHQLHERLAADDRVVSLEQTNVRDLALTQVEALLGCLPGIATVDLSFTSVLPHASHLVELTAYDATLLVLVKPQFEVDHATASRGRGIVTDQSDWLAVLERAASAFERAGAGIIGVMASALRGASGNAEFFVHARHGAASPGAKAIVAMAREAIEQASTR
jgi:23S rRNA (cytidine1920-2'-O)/16S rRNA (cytidine1409-2'-O)-methyltransferase